VSTSVVGGRGAGGQALSAEGRPGLPSCAVSVMATGCLLEVVPAHLVASVMCSGHTHKK
jgi:hypothetical protein